MVRVVLAALLAVGICQPARADDGAVRLIERLWELNSHLPPNEKQLNVFGRLQQMCDAMKLLDKDQPTCANESADVAGRYTEIDAMMKQLASKDNPLPLTQNAEDQIIAAIDEYSSMFDTWYMRHFLTLDTLMKLQPSEKPGFMIHIPLQDDRHKT